MRLYLLDHVAAPAPAATIDAAGPAALRRGLTPFHGRSFCVAVDVDGTPEIVAARLPNGDPKLAAITIRGGFVPADAARTVWDAALAEMLDRRSMARQLAALARWCGGPE